SAAPSSSDSAAPRSRRATGRVPGLVAKPAAATSGAGAKPNCNPPYYFSEGIKTYKPECI
ncbi:MAG TPA: hypothetical protein VF103_00175, partial [Polyangiaceae bacterium]